VSSTATKPGPRQRLLAAAGELFYQQGITAVGVDRVSEVAGVSKRTLYQQFGSKDQLVAESLDHAGASILDMYMPVAGNEEVPPRDQILATFDALRGWQDTGNFRGCPFINTATELRDPGHPARQVARAYKQRLRDYLAGQAERGAAADPQRLADQLIVVFDGAVVQAIMGITRNPDAARTAVEALLDAQGMR
jgi:AcrR family transcriptional regulator